MTKQNLTLDDFLDMLAERIAEKIGAVPTEAEADPAPAKPTRKSTKKAADPEPEDDDADEDEEEDDEFDTEARTAELSKKRIGTLKKMALDMGFDEEEVEGADKDTLIESIVDAEAEDAGVEPDEEDEADDEEDADEDEDESDEDELTREDYEAMTLTALKAEAKEAGYKPADLKGLDKDSIIDMLLGEDEDADEDEDDEDGDDDFYSREELEDMSLAELKALCKDNDITVPRAAKAPALIDLLLGDDE